MVEVPETFKAAAAESLAVEVEIEGDRVVLRLGGELDILTAPVLWERLAEATAVAKSELVLDLSALTFIDSLGLGTLVRAHKRLAERSIPLVLESATEKVRKVFHLTGLDQVFDLR